MTGIRQDKAVSLNSGDKHSVSVQLFLIRLGKSLLYHIYIYYIYKCIIIINIYFLYICILYININI